MCCSIIGEQMERRRKDGLIELHAYSVTKAVDLHGQKLIQIRNPWGRQGEWRGRWSDGTSQWQSSPLIRSALKYKVPTTTASSGCAGKDFREGWTEITICSRKHRRQRPSPWTSTKSLLYRPCVVACKVVNVLVLVPAAGTWSGP
ncbi:unnamed protein product [Ascophyllum nodosum]